MVVLSPIVEFLTEISCRSSDNLLKSEILSFHCTLKLSAGQSVESQNYPQIILWRVLSAVQAAQKVITKINMTILHILFVGKVVVQMLEEKFRRFQLLIKYLQ
jgi:hypothetical protein